MEAELVQSSVSRYPLPLIVLAPDAIMEGRETEFCPTDSWGANMEAEAHDRVTLLGPYGKKPNGPVAASEDIAK